MVLRARLEAPDWSAGHNPDKEALCRKFPLPTNHEVTIDNDPWFLDEEEAAHVCNGTYSGVICGFRQVCLHLSLVNNEQSGTFGGMTVQQRRWIRRNREIIDRSDWRWSNEWRDQVPPPEFFEEVQADDSIPDPQEEATEE